MRNPGVLIELPDGRKCIVYEKQPLLQEYGRVVLTLVDDKHQPCIKDGRPVILLKTMEEYNQEVTEKKYKQIGFID